jgi:hypothetical protein
LAACGRLRRSTAHFSNDRATEANGSISHSRQLRRTRIVLLNTFKGKSENISKRKNGSLLYNERALTSYYYHHG